MTPVGERLQVFSIATCQNVKIVQVVQANVLHRIGTVDVFLVICGMSLPELVVGNKD